MKDTNLHLQVAPLPSTFKGTPQQLLEQMVRRAKIVSPNGTNFIFIGDTEPTSNVGPWLRGGTKWYVFDNEVKRYVPQDITDSEQVWYHIGATAPTSDDPHVWLRTSRDATEADPSYGNPVGWYQWNGSAWAPFVGIVFSGPTDSRPESPVAFTQYYDTDIACLIWFERDQWRTVDGVPGDVKAVMFETLVDALEHNPGWAVLGETNQGLRGRIIMQATKDATGSETVLTVGSGLAQRGAFETFGETDGVDIEASSIVPYPPQLALWHLVKE
jgi:hypothetical protein